MGIAIGDVPSSSVPHQPLHLSISSNDRLISQQWYQPIVGGCNYRPRAGSPSTTLRTGEPATPHVTKWSSTGHFVTAAELDRALCNVWSRQTPAASATGSVFS
jgi:hypothetical protein